MKPFTNRSRAVLASIPISILVLVLFFWRDELDPNSFSTKFQNQKIPSFYHPEHNDNDSPRSKLHYLIPASQANQHLCIHLTSASLNRYPSPVLLGYNTTNPDYDLKKAHSAKFELINRYMQTLTEANENDLVLIMDGYDMVMQLPAEILLQRYFNLVAESDAYLAKRYGLSVKDAHARGLRNTIFWGPDKTCFPLDHSAPRCWAVPRSHLPAKAFGPKTANGDITYEDPRWLNSGTVIGPAGDLKRYLEVTLKAKAETYDPKYKLRNSDQFYFANVWAKQEYFRAEQAGKPLPDAKGRQVPDRKEGETTEMHISIDYASDMFQTRAGYDNFYGRHKFDAPGMKAIIKKDMFDEGTNFVPVAVDMPANIYDSLTRMYKSVPHLHNNIKPSDWLRSLNIGVNFVTKSIFVVWHCTTGKEPVHEDFHKWWFYPYAKSMQKVAVKEQQNGELLSNVKIDGRLWEAKAPYPKRSHELGGAWSDEGYFVEWPTLCAAHDDFLFKGETQGQNKVAA